MLGKDSRGPNCVEAQRPIGIEELAPETLGAERLREPLERIPPRNPILLEDQQRDPALHGPEQLSLGLDVEVPVEIPGARRHEQHPNFRRVEDLGAEVGERLLARVDVGGGAFARGDDEEGGGDGPVGDPADRAAHLDLGRDLVPPRFSWESHRQLAAAVARRVGHKVGFVEEGGAREGLLEEPRAGEGARRAGRLRYHTNNVVTVGAPGEVDVGGRLGLGDGEELGARRRLQPLRLFLHFRKLRLPVVAVGSHPQAIGEGLVKLGSGGRREGAPRIARLRHEVAGFPNDRRSRLRLGGGDRGAEPPHFIVGELCLHGNRRAELAERIVGIGAERAPARIAGGHAPRDRVEEPRRVLERPPPIAPAGRRVRQRFLDPAVYVGIERPPLDELPRVAPPLELGGVVAVVGAVGIGGEGNRHDSARGAPIGGEALVAGEEFVGDRGGGALGRVIAEPPPKHQIAAVALVNPTMCGRVGLGAVVIGRGRKVGIHRLDREAARGADLHRRHGAPHPLGLEERKDS